MKIKNQKNSEQKQSYLSVHGFSFVLFLVVIFGVALFAFKISQAITVLEIKNEVRVDDIMKKNVFSDAKTELVAKEVLGDKTVDVLKEDVDLDKVQQIINQPQKLSWFEKIKLFFNKYGRIFKTNILDGPEVYTIVGYNGHTYHDITGGGTRIGDTTIRKVDTRGSDNENSYSSNKNETYGRMMKRSRSPREEDGRNRDNNDLGSVSENNINANNFASSIIKNIRKRLNNNYSFILGQVAEIHKRVVYNTSNANNYPAVNKSTNRLDSKYFEDRYKKIKNELKQCYATKNQDCVSGWPEKIKKTRNRLLEVSTNKFNNDIATLNKQIHSSEVQISHAIISRESIMTTMEAQLATTKSRRNNIRTARNQYQESDHSCQPGTEWHSVDHYCVDIHGIKNHCERGGGTWHGSLVTGTTGCTCDDKAGGHWMGDYCEYGFNKEQQHQLDLNGTANECGHRLGNWKWDGKTCVALSSEEADKRACLGKNNSVFGRGRCSWKGNHCECDSGN